MTDIAFRPVRTDDDLALLDHALRALSADLGDVHQAGQDLLGTALLSDCPSAHAVLALKGGKLCGAALFSPTFSTVRGAAGVYVSDLWVDASARGLGLGRRLLAAAAAHARDLWSADWLTLAVYDHSTASRRFYDRLGFAPQTGATVMKLGPDGLQRLMKDAG